MIKSTISGQDPATGEDLKDTSQCANNLDNACKCSSFGEGYACVKSNQCLDVNEPPKPTKVARPECSQFLPFSVNVTDDCVEDSNDSLEVASFENSGFTPYLPFNSTYHPIWCELPKEAKCPNSDETCCKTKKPEVEVVEPNTKCGENGKNFQCTPVQVNITISICLMESRY